MDTFTNLPPLLALEHLLCTKATDIYLKDMHTENSKEMSYNSYTDKIVLGL